MKKEEKKTQKASVKERMDAGVAGNKKEEKGKIEREKKTEAAEKKESRQTAEKVKAEETKVEEKAKTPEHVKMPEKAKAEGKQALAESKQEEAIELHFQILNWIPQQTVLGLADSLGIRRASAWNELDDTHWAVKKVKLTEVLKGVGVRVFTMA